MSFRLGLTGGIGMGKTTTAGMFAAQGVPVWDADAAVHRLYAPGGAAVPGVGALFPSAVTAAGIDRKLLSQLLAAAPRRLAELEAVVHPLVVDDRAAFVAALGDALHAARFEAFFLAALQADTGPADAAPAEADAAPAGATE